VYVIVSGNFKVSENEAKKILGNKGDYYRAFAECFYFKPQDEEFWDVDPATGERNLNFKFSFLEQRDKVKNIWLLFKNLLRDLSQDPTLTGAKNHKYERISLTQLLFVICMVSLRNRVVINQ